MTAKRGDGLAKRIPRSLEPGPSEEIREERQWLEPLSRSLPAPHGGSGDAFLTAVAAGPEKCVCSLFAPFRPFRQSLAPRGSMDFWRDDQRNTANGFG
jgi:hypothetical protein